MKNKTAVLLACLVASAPPALAEDLLQVYRDAQKYDAVYFAARRTLEAGRQKLPQGPALLLPNVTLTPNATPQHLGSEAHDPSATTLFFDPDVFSRGYTLTFTQPPIRRRDLS